MSRKVRRRLYTDVGATYTDSLWGMLGDQCCEAFDTHGGSFQQPDASVTPITPRV
jgi:hypothetical protein